MKLFYSVDYVEKSYAIDATRKAKWIADSVFENPIGNVVVVEPEPASRESLLLAHSEEYVAALETGIPKELAESSSFPWDAGTWRSELSSTGGMIAASRCALEEGVSGSLSCGAHHARRERGRLHCTVNDLAVAMLVLRKQGIRRLLYIDVDGHCAGGMYSIMSTIEGYRQMDVSVFESDKYKPDSDSTLDIVRTSDDYLPTINRRLDELGTSLQDFEFCLYYAGMDPHEGSAFGGFPGIDDKLLWDRDKLVIERIRAAGVPCAFGLGGGYLGPGLDQEGLVRLHRQTIEIAASASARRGN